MKYPTLTSLGESFKILKVNAMNPDEFIEAHRNYFSALIEARKRCGDIVGKMNRSVSPAKMLVSGRKKDIEWFRKSTASLERSPVDTEKEVDVFMEKVRKEEYPQRPSRQKAVFCYVGEIWPGSSYHISNLEEILYYGKPYVILPYNGSTYFQSNLAHDFQLSRSYIYTKEALHDGNMEKAKKLAREYFSDSRNDFEKMREHFEIIVEHRGYYAFSILQWRLFLTKFKIRDGRMFGEDAMKVLKEHGIY